MPVLTPQEAPRGGSRTLDGQHHYRSAVVDDVSPDTNSARFLDLICRHPEGRAAIDGARGNHACLGRGTLSGVGARGLRPRVGHFINIKHSLPVELGVAGAARLLFCPAW